MGIKKILGDAVGTMVLGLVVAIAAVLFLGDGLVWLLESLPR